MTYLFDFDGTLVDSMPTFVSVMKEILNENGIAYGDDLVKTITPLGYGGTAKYFITLGLDVPEEKLVSLMQRKAAYEYENNIPAKKNVVEVLCKLKERGDDLNILTASPHTILDPCLKRIGIFDLFTNVWSCDDFGTTKADPGIYLEAAKRLGKKTSEIMFFDDNYNANKVAKSAGMKTCGVYDESSEEYADEIRSLCDMYIKDFSELI